MFSATLVLGCVGTAGCGSGGHVPVRSGRVAVRGPSTDRGLSTISSGLASAPTRGTAQGHGPSAARVKTLLGEKCQKGCPRLVAQFDACLVRNNVEMPHARRALVYDTKGIKTGNARMREAVSECRSELLSTSNG